jgi:hypothetical protein
MKRKKRITLNDNHFQDVMLKKIALKYFIDRYIIGNLPRAPICQLDTPCHIWKGPKKEKYGSFIICNENFQYIYVGRAHRLAYMLFVGNIGSNLVLHTCQEELCVNPDHLILGDHKLNGKHQLMNKKGPTNGHLKHINDLTTEDVKTIRLFYFKYSYPVSELAKMFSKSKSTIYNIVNFKTWDI